MKLLTLMERAVHFHQSSWQATVLSSTHQTHSSSVTQVGWGQGTLEWPIPLSQVLWVA